MFRESFPNPTPEEENNQPEIKRSGLSYLPEEARKKILGVLRKDLNRKDLKKDETLGTIIDLEEAHEEAKLGEPILGSDYYDSQPPFEELGESDRERGTSQ